MTSDASHRIRCATVNDLDALVALEHSAQELPWERSALEEELRHTEARVLVAESIAGELRTEENGGPLVAMCIARRLHDELWILQVGTHRAERRQGLAAKLLETALSSDLSEQTTTAWLEVRADNTSAIALYRAAAFVEVGTRKRYYPATKENGPRVDATIMRRSL